MVGDSLSRIFHFSSPSFPISRLVLYAPAVYACTELIFPYRQYISKLFLMILNQVWTFKIIRAGPSLARFLRFRLPLPLAPAWWLREACPRVSVARYRCGAPTQDLVVLISKSWNYLAPGCVSELRFPFFLFLPLQRASREEARIQHLFLSA